MLALGLLIVWLVLGLVAAVATARWSGRLWKRRMELLPRARTIAAIVTASAMLGALGTLVGLGKAFGAIGGESVDPSQKARMLGEGISEAMNCTVFGIVTWILCAIILSVMMRKRGGRSE
jgi:biopolymer transport protein ExbB/TolQ